jgi:hypothetical protein
LTVGWNTPTWNPSDTPSYSAKYRVNGGAETISPSLTSPSWTTTVTANPGDPVEVAAQNVNGALVSAWSGWVTATADYPATTPPTPAGFSISLIRTGP